MKFAAAILFLLIFLPVLGGMLLTGAGKMHLSSEVSAESVLPMLLYRELPGKCEYQLACAQAVLVRSRVFTAQEKEEKKLAEYYRENLIYEREKKIDGKKLLLCQRAIKETENCMLSVGGKVVEGPYCRASNGWTRNGKEVFSGDDMGWLVGVESTPDLDFAGDRAPVSYTGEELCSLLEKIKDTENITWDLPGSDTILDQITVEASDSSGYVTQVQIQEHQLPGEIFRSALNLPSTSFTLHKEGDRLYFYCRGLGHGMGLSQYGGNQLARDGKNWRKILNYYFPNAQVINKKQK